jgi:hypothetical protein
VQLTKSIFLFIAFGIASITNTFHLSQEVLKVEYIWEDDFSAEEKEKIETWLTGVSEAIAKSFGAYPFTVILYIHQAHANEPVPWAETSRTGEQAVHFHVDTRFTLHDFQMDWTAAHEFSHLSIPYVGRDNMWFSEGYASYWQWQVLQQQGIYSAREIHEKHVAKLDIIKPYYNTDESFLITSDKLKSSFNYPAVYWGGACYFFQVDALLKQDYNTSLLDVIRKYQDNGRLTDNNLDDLIKSLDKISKSKAFSEILFIFQNSSAFEAIFPTVLSGSN